jgi:hypothetical protein
MSERFADAVRRRQIAGCRQGEQLAAREWPLLALHSRLLGGELPVYALNRHSQPQPRQAVGAEITSPDIWGDWAKQRDAF